MKTTRVQQLITLFAATLGALMMVSLLVPTQPAEASQHYTNPCPHYAIQDVFDDPGSDWDNDLVNNSDELYNGLNPCINDTGTFCGGGGNPLCNYRPYVTYTTYSSACDRAVATNPNGDYDGDGISNIVELRNWANPCKQPCPYPTNADLALNPNGSWDNDGISNAVEVNRGTDPCTGYQSNPCPYYTYYDLSIAPTYDWDGDGVDNQHDATPCTRNVVYRTHYVTRQVVPQRLPHVTTYVAPKPKLPTCPYGYPYYHPGTGLCYANPVNVYHY